MKTAVLIDWLSGTIPKQFTSFAGLVDRLCGIFPTPANSWVFTKPLHGYRLAVQENMGILAMSAGGERMGTHLVLSGGTLNELDSIGFSRMQALETMNRIGARISRLDLALDAKMASITPDNLYGALETGNATTKLRNYRIMKGSDGGSTLYLGAPTSEKMFRIYDKGVEQGAPDAQWIRIEAQLKGSIAQRAAKAVLSNGIESVTKGFIADAINYSDDTWEAIVTGEITGIEKSERKLTNTKEWLETVVASALGEILRKEPGYGEIFWQKVEDSIKAKSGYN